MTAADTTAMGTGTPFASTFAGTGVINHPELGLLRYSMQSVPDDGYDQVASVTDIMRRYVMEDTGSPELVSDLTLARQTYGQDDITAIWRFVRDRVTFSRDESIVNPFYSLKSFPATNPIVEAFIRPRDMSVLCSRNECKRIGDCDDFSMYTAALLRTAGIPVAFKTLAADSSDPGQFSHIYTVAYSPSSGRVAMDTSHGDYPGWEAKSPYGIEQEWPVDGQISPAMIAAIVGIGIGAYIWLSR